MTENCAGRHAEACVMENNDRETLGHEDPFLPPPSVNVRESRNMPPVMAERWCKRFYPAFGKNAFHYCTVDNSCCRLRWGQTYGKLGAAYILYPVQGMLRRCCCRSRGINDASLLWALADSLCWFIIIVIDHRLEGSKCCVYYVCGDYADEKLRDDTF